jgi:hypothetical protein
MNLDMSEKDKDKDEKRVFAKSYSASGPKEEEPKKEDLAED